MIHIMFDLETWGTTPGSDIRSIGAVVFDPLAGTLGDEFYVNVSGGARHGLVRDPSTVQWWSEQSEAAQLRLTTDVVALEVGLARFWCWFFNQTGQGKRTADRQDHAVWAHGPQFDVAIVEAAWRVVPKASGPVAAGAPPWSYRAPRDTRTIYEAAGWPVVPFEGVEHDALADAKHQARCVIESYRRLRAPRELLAEAGEMFRFYETSHRAKQPATADTIAKAERNAEIAGRIEGLLV